MKDIRILDACCGSITSFGLIKRNHTQHTWIDVKRNLRFTKENQC